jgi:flagellar biosynthesis/type III secretory pathway chaperone
MKLADLMTSLREHLTMELACHRSLLANMEQQQRELVSNHVAEFSALVEKSEPLISEQTRLRKTREKILLGIAALMERPGKPLTISEVIAQTTEPLKGELSARQLVLKDTLINLRTVQERNQALVRQGLGFMRDLVNTLTGEPNQGGYDRRGRDGGRAGNGKIVNIAG